MAVVNVPSAHAAPPGEHYFIKIRNEDNDRCLTVPGAYEGAPVTSNATCGTAYWRWDVINLLNGYHIIRLNGTQLCVTTPAWNDHVALLYRCELHQDQQWSFTVLWGSWNDPSGAGYSSWIKSRIDWQSDVQYDCLTGPSWTSRRARLYTCNLEDPPWWDQIWTVYDPDA